MTDDTSAASGNGAPECDPPLDQEASRAEQMRQRLRQLPPEVGAVLVAAGVVGLILPGPVGTPLLLAGGLALMPGVFGRMEKWVATRYPKVHGEGMRHVDRFINDIEKRYPPNPPSE